MESTDSWQCQDGLRVRVCVSKPNTEYVTIKEERPKSCHCVSSKLEKNQSKTILHYVTVFSSSITLG